MILDDVDVNSFAIVESYAGSTMFVELADVDADGDLDLLHAANSPSTRRLLLNDGAGGFSLGPAPLALGLAALPLDVDADGLPDLLSRSGDRPVELLRNQGGGVFVRDAWTLPVAGWPVGFAAADIDGDGDGDALVLAMNSAQPGAPDPVAALWCTDAGGLTPCGAFPAGVHVEAAFGDLDADGDPDLVLDGPAAAVWWNDVGTFSRETPLAIPDPTALAVVDLDQDGATDLIAGTAAGIAWWRGDGLGGLTHAATFGPADATDIVTGDVDGDGTPELLIAAPQQASEVWALDPIAGPVQIGGFGSSTATTVDLSAGDIDGDGYDDVALARFWGALPHPLFVQTGDVLMRNRGNLAPGARPTLQRAPYTCGGPLRLRLTGAQPNAQIQLYAGFGGGPGFTWRQPGACTGVRFDASGTTGRFAPVVTADANGRWQASLPGPARCDWQIQAMDLTRCALSNVITP